MLLRIIFNLYYAIFHRVIYNMHYHHIYYSKYDIGFTRYYKHSYLTTTFKYKNKIYTIKIRTSEKTNVQNMRFMCDLKNKNSLIYSELLKAINTFISGISFYIILEKASKKVLKGYDIKYRGYINIKLYTNNFYHNWDFD